MEEEEVVDQGVDPVDFREALSRFASGVTVVTTIDGENRIGVTVSAFSSLSLEPPLVLICIEKRIYIHDFLEKRGRFCVNVLARDQESVSQQFAARVDDRFEGIATRPGLGGVPVIEGSLAVLECSFHASYDGGDHTIFVGRVENTEVADSDPLLYFRSAYRSIE